MVGKTDQISKTNCEHGQNVKRVETRGNMDKNDGERKLVNLSSLTANLGVCQQRLSPRHFNRNIKVSIVVLNMQDSRGY